MADLAEDLGKAAHDAEGQLGAEHSYLERIETALKTLQNVEGQDAERIIHELFRLKMFMGRTERLQNRAAAKVDELLAEMEKLTKGGSLHGEVVQLRKELSVAEGTLVKEFSRVEGGFWDVLDKIEHEEALIEQLKSKDIDASKYEAHLKSELKTAVTALQKMENWVAGAIVIIGKINSLAKK